MLKHLEIMEAGIIRIMVSTRPVKRSGIETCRPQKTFDVHDLLYHKQNFIGTHFVKTVVFFTTPARKP
jgi:hypothetical protein